MWHGVAANNLQEIGRYPILTWFRKVKKHTKGLSLPLNRACAVVIRKHPVWTLKVCSGICLNCGPVFFINYLVHFSWHIIVLLLMWFKKYSQSIIGACAPDLAREFTLSVMKDYGTSWPKLDVLLYLPQCVLSSSLYFFNTTELRMH